MNRKNVNFGDKKVKKVTYYDICFFHILSFCFLLLQISFCIYLLLALLIFLYRFHNNILLYLVSHLCFFDNTFSHSFFVHSKKNYKTPFLSIRIVYYVNCIIFADIPKKNSVGTFININNSKTIKTHSFLQ